MSRASAIPVDCPKAPSSPRSRPCRHAPPHGPRCRRSPAGTPPRRWWSRGVRARPLSARATRFRTVPTRSRAFAAGSPARAAAGRCPPTPGTAGPCSTLRPNTRPPVPFAMAICKYARYDLPTFGRRRETTARPGSIRAPPTRAGRTPPPADRRRSSSSLSTVRPAAGEGPASEAARTLAARSALHLPFAVWMICSAASSSASARRVGEILHLGRTCLRVRVECVEPLEV